MSLQLAGDFALEALDLLPVVLVERLHMGSLLIAEDSQLLTVTGSLRGKQAQALFVALSNGCKRHFVLVLACLDVVRMRSSKLLRGMTKGLDDVDRASIKRRVADPGRHVHRHVEEVLHVIANVLGVSLEVRQ